MTQRFRRLVGSNDRWFRACWLMLSVGVLVPIWSARLLPILDLPVHLALIRGWHSMSDARFGIAQHYALRLRPSPYLLHYALVNVGMFAFDIETASKIVLSLYALTLPASLAACARALGRSPKVGIAGFALVFNPCWTYGYLSYLLSTSAFLFSLAALFAWLTMGRRAALSGLVLGSLVTYFGHVLAWAFLTVSVGALAGAEVWVRKSAGEVRADRPRRVAAVGALVPSLVLAAVTTWNEQRDRAYVVHDAPFRGTWRTPLQAIVEFPRRASDIFPGSLDTVALLLIAIVMVALAMRYGISGARRLVLVIGVGAIMWLALPYEISRPVIFFQISGRLPPLLVALLVLLPAVPQSAAVRLPTTMFALCALAVFLRLTILSRDFDRRNKPFFDLIDPLPEGSSTMVVVRHMMEGEHPEEASGDPATSAPAYWGFAEWPMALHGGYAPYVFDQGVPIVPTHRLVSPPFPPPDDLLERDAPEFDFYVIRNPTAIQQADPRWRIMRRVGDWVLFANARDSVTEGARLE